MATARQRQAWLQFLRAAVTRYGTRGSFWREHREMPRLLMVPAAWIFTFAFVAMPEELFFRGLVQNLLERRMTRNLALLVASILFGLSHFNKRSGGQFLVAIAGHTLAFNWRYVLLATVAGIFYGRAPDSAGHTSIMTMDEARQMAIDFTRLPELQHARASQKGRAWYAGVSTQGPGLGLWFEGAQWGK